MASQQTELTLESNNNHAAALKYKGRRALFKTYEWTTVLRDKFPLIRIHN